MKLIFVCTSNVCRSPPAAALASKWLSDHQREGNVVISRSLTTAYEPEDSPASDYSIQIMKENYGIDISSHRSRLLTIEDVNDADVIIGITNGHRHHIIEKYPHARNKTIAMPKNVPDPWHGPFDEYLQCLQFIDSQMDELFVSIDSLTTQCQNDGKK